MLYYRFATLLNVNGNIDIELKQIGKQIKQFRLLKGMTQNALASSCDIDVRTIQMIESCLKILL